MSATHAAGSPGPAAFALQMGWPSHAGKMKLTLAGCGG